MNKPKTPAPSFVSPLPENYRKPIADISPESWKALLEQSTKDEIAAGERARAKGKALIAAMSPEERNRLGLPEPTQGGTENSR
jgi:hypothetical protein